MIRVYEIHNVARMLGLVELEQVEMKDRNILHARDAQAFSRLELAAVLAALGLLALLVVPALANQRERSARVLCVNNLRLTGQALQQWGTEHGDRVPWRVPWYEGGTQVSVAPPPPPGTPPPIWSGLQNNAWFQWSWISNELRTPKILACPSDTDRRPASNWCLLPSGGFLHPTHQNRAVSYFLGLDVLPEHPDGLLAGDRNVRYSWISGGCSSGVAPARELNRTGLGIGIRDGLHVEAGNFLFKDGRVEELSNQAFVRRWLETSAQADLGGAHYVVP